MNTKEFPTHAEFVHWYKTESVTIVSLYNYFKDRVRTVMPEVGKEYAGVTRAGSNVKGRLDFVCIEGWHCVDIRHITTPTRDNIPTTMPNADQLKTFSEWLYDNYGLVIADRLIHEYVKYHITTPTRDEVLEKCRKLGLTDAEIETLTGGQP